MHNYKLSEGVEQGDLRLLVHPELHVDEFQSKLGKDKDVCVISFKVADKAPAADLVSFIEKGYEWVIDADVSSGEMDDGDYIVFVEIDRSPELPKQLMKMLEDLMNVTEQDLKDWRVRYQKSQEDNPATEESLEALIPLTPEEYESKYGKKDIDALKTASGQKVDTKAPKNDYTESLRTLAGII